MHFLAWSWCLLCSISNGVWPGVWPFFASHLAVVSPATDRSCPGNMHQHDCSHLSWNLWQEALTKDWFSWDSSIFDWQVTCSCAALTLAWTTGPGYSKPIMYTGLLNRLYDILPCIDTVPISKVHARTGSTFFPPCVALQISTRCLSAKPDASLKMHALHWTSMVLQASHKGASVFSLHAHVYTFVCIKL